MKTVYLHIGQYKTGSSSIQHFLTNETDYLENQGIHYCQTGLLTNEPEIGVRHYKLTIQTLTEKCLWPELVNEINQSPAHTFVISYENLLFGVNDQQLAYISDLLKPFDVKIVCYLRRHDLFMNSWYAESVKSHKGKSEPADFITHHKNLCFYHRAISLWVKHFGKESMTVFSFDNLNAQKINVVAHFLNLLAINLPEDYECIRENRSLGSAGTRNMIRFNRKVDLPREIHRHVSTFLTNYFDNDEPVRLFTQEQAINFVDEFKEDASMLIDELSLPADFFSEHYDDYQVLTGDSDLGSFMADLVRMSKSAYLAKK